mmetsp:Transcript_46972/g.123249  ORF Transcript_46972/g.123249 Transcript_46972/m.123249 type:complete len:210 (+) Transcript_46972:439-1068(+)
MLDIERVRLGADAQSVDVPGTPRLEVERLTTAFATSASPVNTRRIARLPMVSSGSPCSSASRLDVEASFKPHTCSSDCRGTESATATEGNGDASGVVGGSSIGSSSPYMRATLRITANGLAAPRTTALMILRSSSPHRSLSAPSSHRWPRTAFTLSRSVCSTVSSPWIKSTSCSSAEMRSGIMYSPSSMRSKRCISDEPSKGTCPLVKR